MQSGGGESSACSGGKSDSGELLVEEELEGEKSGSRDGKSDRGELQKWGKRSRSVMVRVHTRVDAEGRGCGYCCVGCFNETGWKGES